MKNNLTLDSRLSDLLAIDLPRTAILRDIHLDISNAILSLKIDDTVKMDWISFIEQCGLYQYENFYRFWIEYAPTDYKNPPTFFLEVLFIYGLLLPYYLDYTKTDFSHLDYFTKKPNEQFRVIKPLNDNDYPHPFSLHHAHQLTKILIDKCNKFNSPANQNAIKANEKTREKRRSLNIAYKIISREYPSFNQTQLTDKMLDWLDDNSPNDEFNRDSVKNTVGDFKKGKFFPITWSEIISIQNELLAYIRTMPTL
nr:hypothetical protein [Moraxella osloensis]